MIKDLIWSAYFTDSVSHDNDVLPYPNSEVKISLPLHHRIGMQSGSSIQILHEQKDKVKKAAGTFRDSCTLSILCADPQQSNDYNDKMSLSSTERSIEVGDMMSQLCFEITSCAFSKPNEYTTAAHYFNAQLISHQATSLCEI